MGGFKLQGQLEGSTRECTVHTLGEGKRRKECWLLHEHKRAELRISVASPCIDILFLKCTVNPKSTIR